MKIWTFAILFINFFLSSEAFLKSCSDHVYPVHVSERLLRGKWFVVRRSRDFFFYMRENLCDYGLQYAKFCRISEFNFDYNEYGWHLNHTSTHCFKPYRNEQLCNTERFKLYKPRHSLSSKGSFIQARENFFCRGGWCPMDPKRDVEILPRNKPANFHFLYLDKDLALIYACQMCNGAITGGVDYFAQVLSRTTSPDWAKVAEVEKEMKKRKLDVKMENTFNYACPTDFIGTTNGVIDYNL